jgi:integrase/recombinase XerC
MTAITLAGAVEKFLGYLRHERRYSAGTLDNYARSLAALRNHAELQRVPRWRDLRSEQVQTFIAGEHRRGRARRRGGSESRAWRALAQGAA